MKNLETTIVINANKKQVWETLMSFEEYPDWNPFIKQIAWKGKDQLDITIDPGDKKPMQFKPIVLKNHDQKEFRWIGKLFLKGIFDGEHYFKLQSIGENQTKLIHGENFKGIFSRLILKFIGEDTLSGFNRMNVALKKRTEQHGK